MKPRLRVYIADDSISVRERLAGRLAEMEGIELVGQSGHATQAITEIRQLRPDVAILDIRMPGGNGIQALAAAKQNAAPPVVIMLTAFAYSQYRKRYLAAGADYFFDKTTEYEDVFTVLERLHRPAGDQSA